jgi:hypothetical protein
MRGPCATPGEALARVGLGWEGSGYVLAPAWIPDGGGRYLAARS